MHLVLQMVSGPRQGSALTVYRGQSLRIGRGAVADECFPDDKQMSRLHARIDCDANGGRLVDLNSSNGTLLNGTEVKESVLSDGDRVQAGDTLFVVRVCPDVPRSLREMLAGELQPLYVVLDAAQEPSVLKIIVESDAQRVSLFEGRREAPLVHFAPHLLRLSRQSPLLKTLEDRAWGRNWGVFVTCDRTLHDLAAHLRQLLTVTAPPRGEMHFRFYDPRVLRAFLPTCFAGEVDQFFGPVKFFAVEDEDPGVLLRFANSRAGAERTKLSLSAST